MKKATIFLCILLSLFVVACAEPENKPEEKNDIVIKVRNADLPEGTTTFTVDAFGETSELFNPSARVDVSEGEFTNIPLNDAFISEFKSGFPIQMLIASTARQM